MSDNHEATRAFATFVQSLYACRPPELVEQNTREALELRIQAMEKAVDAFREYLATIVSNTAEHVNETSRLAAEADIRIQAAWEDIRCALRCAMGNPATCAHGSTSQNVVQLRPRQD